MFIEETSTVEAVDAEVSAKPAPKPRASRAQRKVAEPAASSGAAEATTISGEAVNVSPSIQEAAAAVAANGAERTTEAVAPTPAKRSCGGWSPYRSH